MKEPRNKYLTPIKCIRAECKYCMAGSIKEIKECQMIKCSSWGYRMGRRPTSNMLRTLSDYFNEVKKVKFILTPIKAIRSYCSDCSYGPKDIRNCSIKTCSFWLFRLGRRPTQQMLIVLNRHLIQREHGNS